MFLELSMYTYLLPPLNIKGRILHILFCTFLTWYILKSDVIIFNRCVVFYYIVSPLLTGKAMWRAFLLLWVGEPTIFRPLWPLGWLLIAGDRFLPWPVLGIGEVLGFQGFLMMHEVGLALVLSHRQLLSPADELFLAGVPVHPLTMPGSNSSVMLFAPQAPGSLSHGAGSFWTTDYLSLCCWPFEKAEKQLICFQILAKGILHVAPWRTE